jgi:hypothetical protein
MVPTLKSTPMLFSVLSPLAEGADHLIAREVLKIPGALLEVVLPLEKEKYRCSSRNRLNRAIILST